MKKPIVVNDKFDALVARLAQDAWYECDLRKFTNKDFQDFGAYLGMGEQSFLVVYRFGVLTKRVKAGPEASRSYYKGLNFVAFGQQANRDEVGIATIENFLRMLTQSGVGKEARRSFCQELHFPALGLRAMRDEVSVATIERLLRLLAQAGIGKERRKTFCDELELPVLGQQANRDELGFTRIRTFVELLMQIGVDESRLCGLAESLNWHDMGQRALNEEKKLSFPLFTFRALLNIEAITKEMCREFVEGVGWDNLRNAHDRFSPDEMAASKIFLTKKCEYKAKDLTTRELTWLAEDWLHSFRTNPCSGTDNFPGWRRGFLKYALTGLLFKDVTSLLLNAEMDLRAWNILTRNIALIDKRVVHDTVTPLLSRLPASKLETLFCEADLRSIGSFLHNFNQYNGVFEWLLPADIDFKKIKFKEQIERSSLQGTAHFIFNFFNIGRKDCSFFFASQLNDYERELWGLVEQADLREIDFFTWNWYLTMPEGKMPLLIGNPKFHYSVFGKVGMEGAEQEYLLGIIGTMHLLRYEIPSYFFDVIDIEMAKGDCQRIAAKGAVRMFRMLAGLFALSNEALSLKERRAYMLAARKCERNLKLDVPSEESFLRFIKSKLNVD